MPAPPDVTVRKFLYDGTPHYVWEGRLVERDDELVVLEAYFTRGKRDLGYVVFERGDLFVEFYYFDRWYNVFQIYSATGVLKGWYCNVGAPAQIAGGQLTFVDFALDVFAYPDHTFVVLDEHEFEELARTIYRPIEVEAAKAALAKLTALAETGHLPGRPFGGLPTPAAGL